MRTLMLFSLMVIPVIIYSQDRFANTLTFSDSLGSPKADLSSLRWIEGHWRGVAFGGITEEVWSPPLGGSMMCAFKLVVNGNVKFYELATISEENSTLILRLKHFNSNLKGWEDKDKTIDFRLVKVTDSKIYFDEFTIERVGAKKMNIYVVIESGGKREEVKFAYTKVRG
ncbi:MAG: hypothetical protein HOP30_09405 [Cyclobacteriaceae bacterium]|nr:hypothetical protein [Cyclobacteriaceae bacterium]